MMEAPVYLPEFQFLDGFPGDGNFRGSAAHSSKRFGRENRSFISTMVWIASTIFSFRFFCSSKSELSLFCSAAMSVRYRTAQYIFGFFLGQNNNAAVCCTSTISISARSFTERRKDSGDTPYSDDMTDRRRFGVFFEFSPRDPGGDVESNLRNKWEGYDYFQGDTPFLHFIAHFRFSMWIYTISDKLCNKDEQKRKRKILSYKK
jgi:hypothetical protein